MFSLENGIENGNLENFLLKISLKSGETNSQKHNSVSTLFYKCSASLSTVF